MADGSRIIPRRWLVWLLFGASMASTLAVLVLALVGNQEYGPAELMIPISGAIYAAMGLLITRRQPSNRIGLLSLLVGNGITFMGLIGGYGEVSTTAGEPGLIVQLAYTLASMVQSFVILGPFFLLPLLFPDGRPLSRRWAWLMWIMVSMGVVIGVLEVLDPGQDTLTGNPGSLLLALPPGQAELIGLVQQLKLALIYLWIPGIFAAPLGLFLRWRRSRGVARRQLSAFARLTGLVVGVQIAMELLGALILPALFESALYELSTPLVWLSLPIIFGLTVLRYRLYDVELLINRAMVYGALSALLALIYFGSVIFLQGLFSLISGGDSPLVIVLSTLFIAALFTPLRQRIQVAIDRRFYRQQYDARRTVQRFAATARDEVDLEQLTGALLRSIEETMQPDGLSLWLKDHGAEIRAG